MEKSVAILTAREMTTDSLIWRGERLSKTPPTRFDTVLSVLREERITD
jgi:hypothetical protein